MHATVVSELLKQLRSRLSMISAAHRTDAELLDRFIEARDEAAFETLVLRHGPMVYGVKYGAGKEHQGKNGTSIALR